MVGSSKLVLASLIIGFGSNILAEQQTTTRVSGNNIFDLSLEELVNVEITIANRTHQPLSDTLESVTVISRIEIENFRAYSINDLLMTVIGADSSRTGGIGKTSAIFLRGLNPGHVVTFINGIRTNSATRGRTNFQHIPVSQIERIEILHGLGSSLYGSSALGGVVNIITHQGDDINVVNGELTIGTQQTISAKAGFNAGNDDMHFSLQASRLDTDGIDIGRLNDPDRDSYSRQAVSGSLKKNLGNLGVAEVHFMTSDGISKIDSSTSHQGMNDESDFRLQAISANSQLNLSEIWQLSVQLGESRDETDSTNVFDTRQTQGSLQTNFRLTNGIFSIGADYLKDQVSTNLAFSVKERSTSGVFSRWQGRVGQIRYGFGIRYDDNDVVESSFTYDLHWGYEFSGNRRLTLAYGTAFKAPSFNELYFPGFGNPSLKPEIAKSVEIGFSNRSRNILWGVNAYHTRVEDLIAFGSFVRDGESLFLPQNLKKARIDGVEANVTIRHDNWQGKLNAHYIHHRDLDTGDMLGRRARAKLYFSLDRSFGQFNVGGSVLFRSHAFDSPQETRRMPGFGLTSLRFSYEPTNRLVLRFSINNVFDKAYETASGFNSPDRAAYLTLQYRKGN